MLMENERGWTEIERFRFFFFFVRTLNLGYYFLVLRGYFFCKIETFIRKFSGIIGGGINKFCKLDALIMIILFDTISKFRFQHFVTLIELGILFSCIERIFFAKSKRLLGNFPV